MVDITSAADMEDLGGRLARHCPAGGRLYMRGPLGAGKTTLVRGFLRALGFAGTVKSPTYTLVEPYNLNKHTVIHFDFYRIAQPVELETIGVRDYFDRSAICLVEWPEKAGACLEAPDLLIAITFGTDRGTGSADHRRVELQSMSATGEALLAQLA